MAKHAKPSSRPASRKASARKPATEVAEVETAEALLDLDQAIARLATTKPTFYRWLRDGRVKGVKVGRQWRFRPQDIDACLRGEAAMEVLTADIGPLQRRLDALLVEAGAEAGALKLAAGVLPPGSDPVAPVVEAMIHLGLLRQATTLFLDVRHDGEGTELWLRYRRDGEVGEFARADARLLPPLIHHWKLLASCDAGERRLPQDGRLTVSLDGKSYDLRVNVIPSVTGESLTVRIINAASSALSLAEIPFTPHNRRRVDAALVKPRGMMFSTGPTGSGKTTTMYALLNHLLAPGVKAVSIEDPVEVRLPGVIQVPVREELPFAHALRAVLRSDPDVIQVTEIRDRETLHVAMGASLTGQILLMQLHADDAAAALTRMVDMGTDPTWVAEAVSLVIGQRLVRKLCPHCSVPETWDATRASQASALAREGGLDGALLSQGQRRPVGCERCGHVGYRGRTVINEVLVMNAELAAALRRGAKAKELRRLAIDHGMVGLTADGVWRAAQGETTLEEILRTVPPER